jgi:hypothetical protein
MAKLHRWAVADLGRRFDDVFLAGHAPARGFTGLAGTAIIAIRKGVTLCRLWQRARKA